MEEQPTIASKKGSKKFMRYISDPKLRTQTANRSGATIKSMVAGYVVKTKAKAYLKLQYVGPSGKTITFAYGKDFEMQGDVFPSKMPSLKVIEQAVAKGIEEGVTKIVKIPDSVTPHSSDKPTCSKFINISPHKRSIAFKNSSICHICGRSKVVKDDIMYDSAWIGCTGFGQKDCGKWFHTDCLGFPGVQPNEVDEMPNFYCVSHISAGRRQKKVPLRYADEPSPKDKKEWRITE